MLVGCFPEALLPHVPIFGAYLTVVFCRALALNLKPIIQEILQEYALPIHGDHGVAHWARVLENGRRLATLTGEIFRWLVCLPCFMIHDESMNARIRSMDCAERTTLHSCEAVCLMFQIRSFVSFIERVRDTLTSELIRTSQCRPAGIQIDLIWDALALHLTRASSAPTKPERKK